MAELNYKVNEEELEQSIDAVPAGEYIAIIESSQFDQLNNGNGMSLKLVYQIIDGPFKGRKIFENLNIVHTNKQAEQISRRNLNSIGVAVGVSDIKDSAQIHDIPLLLEVTVKESTEYGRQNKIKKHLPIKDNGVSSFTKPAQSQPQVETAEPVKKKQAWE